MKKYPKLLQCDGRGQIVIPKDVRRELDIDEGTGFWVYTITEEGILLKIIKPEELEENKEILEQLKSKADKIRLKKKNLDSTASKYKKKKEGNLELI